MNLEHRTSNKQRDAAVCGRSVSAIGRVYDLEERLLEFAVAVIDVTERLPNTRAGNHLAGQLLRSGTSPYGNHGEAQAPESMDDFIHKFKVCLKELREARRWARLVERKNWLSEDPRLLFLLREADELIRIFKASIQTAERNRLAAARVTGRTTSSTKAV